MKERERGRRGERVWWKPDARSTPPLSSGHSVQSGTAALIEGLPAVNRLDRMDGWVDRLDASIPDPFVWITTVCGYWVPGKIDRFEPIMWNRIVYGIFNL